MPQLPNSQSRNAAVFCASKGELSFTRAIVICGENDFSSRGNPRRDRRLSISAARFADAPPSCTSAFTTRAGRPKVLTFDAVRVYGACILPMSVRAEWIFGGDDSGISPRNFSVICIKSADTKESRPAPVNEVPAAAIFFRISADGSTAIKTRTTLYSPENII